MVSRIGFWSVLALVIGSQIGSGILMSPANLAPFGVYSLCGWIVSALGAISLALVFASLCSRFPKTGGPHIYIEQLFSRDVAFFAGWTYWVVSWISTAAVVVAAVGYLSPLISSKDPSVYLAIEILLVLLIGSLNLLGVSIAGRAETIFTILKFLPLFIVPAVAIFYFDIDNFQMSEHVAQQPVSTSIAQAALLSLWGFIGLESATASAGSVQNASKTIPRAVVLGTIIVAGIYIFNSLAIMGLIPGSELQKSSAPYVDVASRLFSGQHYIWVSLAASMACIGTLNAWVLTSGQISLGLAQDRMMPKIFSKLNSWSAPYISIIISCLGIIPLLILTADHNIATQVAEVIDFSVTSFLFIYLLCSIVYLVFAWRDETKNPLAIINGLLAMIFCIWVISETSLYTIIISSLFTLSGIPLYFFWYRAKIKNK